MKQKIRFLVSLLFVLGLGFWIGNGIWGCSSSGSGSSGGETTGGGGTGGVAGNPPAITSSCTVFPADNPWNLDISGEPVDPNSDNYISFIQSHGKTMVHPDFGSDPTYGIPYEIVNGDQALVPINFTDSGDESDPGPYPIPSNARVEVGDGHVLVVDQDHCVLYELYLAEKIGSGWDASSGAKFDLTSNALRPDGWTSADAAGLPIFAGLVRYDEAVTQGEIRHALRVTFSTTQAGYIHPATHLASSETDANAPPMGLRLRLKASYDISGFTGTSLVVLKALKKYGMFVADNGSNWYISGSTDTRWNDDDLNQLKTIPGTAFEVVKAGTIHH